MTHDIVQVANAVLGQSLSECGLEAADVNGDGSVNILDIVQIANIILGGRTSEDATSANLHKTGDSILLKADGYIGGIQMTLNHNAMFSINLTESSLHADYVTMGNTTTLVVVMPENEEIFTYILRLKMSRFA